MKTKRLPLLVSEELYRRLERIAEAEDRIVEQQARYFLRQAIEAAERLDPADSEQPTAPADDP